MLNLITGFLALVLSTSAGATKLIEVPMVFTPTLSNDIVMSNGFKPHRGFAGTGYRMEPLHRLHSPLDYKAWHDESWNELKVLFDRAWSWPREMSEAQNASDLELKHYRFFLDQSWISYTIMNPKGNRVIGSLYITPNACGAYGAYAFYWITTPVRAEVEAAFHAETKVWLNTVFPWGSTFYPGPEVSDDVRGELYKKAESGVCL